MQSQTSLTDAVAAVEAARTNPAVFVAMVTGSPPPPLQRRIIAHVLRHPSFYLELPRGHMKTTTLAALMAWYIGAYPHDRNKVISQNDDVAFKTVGFVRSIVEGNVFREVFPEVYPVDDGASRLTVRRTKSMRDPTLEGSGVFGRASGRADRIWFDDVADLRNSVLQPALRDQVREAVRNNWLPMLDYSRAKEPSVWRSNTPYHDADITADWRRIHAERGTLLREPCVGLASPWPEVFTPAILEDKRSEMGPIGYARAYELVPLSSEVFVFRPEWLQDAMFRAEAKPVVTRTVAALDWGYSSKERGKEDPDYSVLVVAEMDGLGHCYCTDILRVRESFPEFMRQAEAVLKRRNCPAVIAETNGPQRGIADAFQESTGILVVSATRASDKMLRAAAVQSFVMAKRLHLPCDESGQVRGDFAAAYEEMVAFPAGAHDDCVDVLVDLCSEAPRHMGGDLARPQALGIAKRDPVQRIFGKTAPSRGMFAV